MKLPTIDTCPTKRIVLVKRRNRRNVSIKAFDFSGFDSKTINALWESIEIPTHEHTQKEWDWWAEVAQEQARRTRR